MGKSFNSMFGNIGNFVIPTSQFTTIIKPKPKNTPFSHRNSNTNLQNLRCVTSHDNSTVYASNNTILQEHQPIQLFSSIKTALEAQISLIYSSDQDLNKLLRQKIIDNNEVQNLYNKITSSYNELQSTLKDIYHTSKINQVICNSIFQDSFKQIENITFVIQKKCQPYLEQSVDYDTDKLIHELDGDIQSYQTAAANLLNSSSVTNIHSNQTTKAFLTYAQDLLANPPQLSLNENASEKQKKDYLKTKLNYALKLKDIYEGLSEINKITQTTNQENSANNIVNINEICSKVLLEPKIRHNLHNIRTNLANNSYKSIHNNHEYNKYLSQTLLHNIKLHQIYDAKHDMYFWKQCDRQSCVFASICNAKQFSSTQELLDYLSKNFSTKTLETWLLELLDDKIGVSLSNALNTESFDNDNSKLKQNNIIGMYRHDDISDGGHAVCISKKDDGLYLFDSGAKYIQKFADYDSMMSVLNKQYGNRFHIGRNDDNFSTLLFGNL